MEEKIIKEIYSEIDYLKHISYGKSWLRFSLDVPPSMRNNILLSIELENIILKWTNKNELYIEIISD